MSIYWLAEFLKALENKLPQPEQEYADAMLGIVSRHGKLANGDGKGIWVGYVPPEQNDNLEMGIKCSNCYFFESDNVCKIVATTIKPDGYCRLAAIPDGIVRKMTDDE